MAEYDKSSKWLIQHHGDAILRLGGVGEIRSWRPLQAEVVQPRQLPDGLLEVELPGRDLPVLFVIELATYPEARLLEQLQRDMLQVYLDRRVLPEVLAIVLHPKGSLRIADQLEVASALGWSGCRFNWRVVELWNIPAEDLLATGDPGIVPWVPLARSVAPAEEVLRECREIIEKKAASEERQNLLAVTYVLARLRYTDPRLLSLLGGSQVMIESPAIQELLADQSQNHILVFLKSRFGSVPLETETALRRIEDLQRLEELMRAAARCPDLASFHRELPS
jgi:hypothetical protein